MPGLVYVVLVANQVLLNPINTGLAILGELHKIKVAVGANANHLSDALTPLHGQGGLPLLVFLTVVVCYE